MGEFLNIVKNLKEHKKDIILLVLFLFFIWLLFASVWDNKINHNYPIGYTAGDSFWHEVFSQSLLDNKNFRYIICFNIRKYAC